MRIIAVIPARYAATRFPGKLMQLLGNYTVIAQTYKNTVATGLFDDVFVATDSAIIFDEIISNGGKAIMSIKNHESGSDRIAEAIVNIDADVVVNVQGDEPFIHPQSLKDLIQVFSNPNAQVASMMHELHSIEEINNPNIVKVVIDKENNALYFSRSVIPYNRNNDFPTTYQRHIGVYAYRKSMLLEFVQWPLSVLEQIEKLEQLRYLENGVKIKMVSTSFTGIGIDTPEDLEKAIAFLANKNA
ncbi:MAG: 3-deoxy-manno-octulosonate cytidylyltransferase [Chitinophagaceae bacterium]|nr:3-deoxy-manno-octulosonate cytidylyltransferase [Chitinophagaceae bacterium]